ncbi:putative signal transduction protein [Methanocaldococcus villosus KIN24-T80]|uniref:Putative signal transduction protein n=1 Tax=Methanocaldococcus villosus KIN24-T80 TaxID=1069083 RepID=N6V2Z2_9EURY|nr:CBS domain-containing protein [Methanocaldococcus villosus]ENN96603.1 putative signal transduction protein [Methanocaldococcus villosus KIN24-T80]
MIDDVPVVIAMSEPVFVRDNTSIYNTLKEMLKKNKKYCIVINSNNDIVGVATFSDIIKAIILEKRDGEKTSIKDVADSKVITVKPTTSIKEVLELMEKEKISKLPVVDNNKIVGIITKEELVDILPYIIGPLKDLVEYLLKIIDEELKSDDNKEEKKENKETVKVKAITTK